MLKIHLEIHFFYFILSKKVILINLIVKIFIFNQKLLNIVC